jgi:hypothetical protein
MIRSRNFGRGKKKRPHKRKKKEKSPNPSLRQLFFFFCVFPHKVELSNGHDNHRRLFSLPFLYTHIPSTAIVTKKKDRSHHRTHCFFWKILAT